MSEPDFSSNPVDAAPKKSNRKVWWIVGCVGLGGCGFISLGVIATIVVPNVWMKMDGARRTRIQAHLRLLRVAVDTYKDEHAVYPSSLEQLTARGEMFASQDLPRDPWGHAYQLLPAQDPSAPPRLLTFGRDGQPGGVGEDADIEQE